MAELDHSAVTLGLIVGEGNSRIVQEAQCVLFAGRKAQEEIVPGSARRPAAPVASILGRCAYQWGLGFMECQSFGEYGVVTTFKTFDERRFQNDAPFACEIGRVTGTPQQSLHLAGPGFFLNFDESLEFAQVMGIA